MTKVIVGIDPGKENCAVVAYNKADRQMIYFKGQNAKAWAHLLNLKDMFGDNLEVRIELPVDTQYARNRNGSANERVAKARDFGINRGFAYAMLDFCKVSGIKAKHHDCGRATKELKKMYVERKLQALNLLQPANQHCFDAAYIILDEIQ